MPAAATCRVSKYDQVRVGGARQDKDARALARTDLEDFFSSSALEAAFSSLGLRLSFLRCGTSPPEAWLSMNYSAAIGIFV